MFNVTHGIQNVSNRHVYNGRFRFKQSLRIITGGIKSTPILAMEMFSGTQPLGYSREIASLKTYERILRTPYSIWKNYECIENRLKSKISFVHRVRGLYDKYDLPSVIQKKYSVSASGKNCHESKKYPQKTRNWNNTTILWAKIGKT